MSDNAPPKKVAEATQPTPQAIPKAAFDWRPAALLLALPLLALPALGNMSTWVTLTFAGLAMGLIIFVIG